jgi:metal-responsive CopG/Arc/MetJ family transcriptional regulator
VSTLPVRQDGRTLVNVRLRNTGLAVIDRMAANEGKTRSEMIRVLLSEAITARRSS